MVSRISLIYKGAHPPTALKILTQPQNVVSGSSNTIVVAVVNSRGEVVGKQGTQITAAIATGTGVIVSPLTAITGTDGRTTWALQITGSGSHTVTFSASGLTSATTNAFTVSLNLLSLSIQPTTGVDNIVFSTQPVVATSPVIQGLQVTATITTGNGNLIGVTQVQTNSAGNAVFTTLGINASTTPDNFVITFSASNYSSVATGTITVLVDAILVVITPAAGSISNNAFTTQPRAQRQTTTGVPLTQAGVSCTFVLNSGLANRIGTNVALTDSNGFAQWVDIGLFAAAPPQGCTYSFTAPNTQSSLINSITVQATAPSPFGAFEEIDVLFNPPDIYKYAPTNAESNPLDLLVTLNNPNDYGWYSVTGGTDPSPDLDTVNDPVRGTVTRVMYSAGDAGGASPKRWWGPQGFRTLGPTITGASATRSGVIITMNTVGNHGFVVGDTVYVGPSYFGGYGGYAQVATIPVPTQFTFIIASYENPAATLASAFTVQKVTLPTKIGIGFWVKLSANWTDNGNVGTKLAFIRSPIGDSQRDRINVNDVGGQNHYISLSGNQTQMRLTLGLQSGGAPGGAQNFPASQTNFFLRDVWVKVQVYVESNTPGVANGKIRIWATDSSTGIKTLVSNSDVVPYHAVGQARGFNGIFFDPTYGGGLNPVPADQAWYIDDMLVATALPPSSVVDLSLYRILAGSGITRVMNAIPLQQGQLTPANLTANNLQITVGGTEVPATFVDLSSRYPDGTVKSVGVHFDATLTSGAAAVAGQLRIGAPRTAGGVTPVYPVWIKGTEGATGTGLSSGDTPPNPDGVALCTADHYCATRILGPLRTRIQINALAASDAVNWGWCKTHIDAYETEYDYCWGQTAEFWNANLQGRGFANYDHITMAWQLFFMDPTLEHWRRARMMGANFLHDWHPTYWNATRNYYAAWRLYEFNKCGADGWITYLMCGEPRMYEAMGQLVDGCAVDLQYFSAGDATSFAIARGSRARARGWQTQVAGYDLNMPTPVQFPQTDWPAQYHWNPTRLATTVSDLLGGGTLSSNVTKSTWTTSQNQGTTVPGTHLADDVLGLTVPNTPHWGFPTVSGAAGGFLAWQVGGIFTAPDWSAGANRQTAMSRTSSKQYMDAMLAQAMSWHYEIYQADARIIASIQKLCDWWWGDGAGSGMWRRGPKGTRPSSWGMIYISEGYDDRPDGSEGGQGVEAQENGMFVEPYSWLWEKTGIATYRTIADTICKTCVGNIFRGDWPFIGHRYLDECFFHTFNHIGRR